MNPKLRVAIATLPFALTSVVSSAEDAGFRRYAEIRNVEMKLFIEADRKFGERVRLAATLQACDNERLAKAVDVGGHMAFLTTRLAELGKVDERVGKVFRTLSPDESFRLVSAVADQLMVYQIGYKDGIRAASATGKAICSAASGMADTYLRNKK